MKHRLDFRQLTSKLPYTTAAEIDGEIARTGVDRKQLQAAIRMLRRRVDGKGTAKGTCIVLEALAGAPLSEAEAEELQLAAEATFAAKAAKDAEAEQSDDEEGDELPRAGVGAAAAVSTDTDDEEEYKNMTVADLLPPHVVLRDIRRLERIERGWNDEEEEGEDDEDEEEDCYFEAGADVVCPRGHEFIVCAKSHDTQCPECQQFLLPPSPQAAVRCRSSPARAASRLPVRAHALHPPDFRAKPGLVTPRLQDCNPLAFGGKPILCYSCDVQLDCPKKSTSVVVCSGCSSRLARSAHRTDLQMTKAAPQPILAILDDGAGWFAVESPSSSEDEPAVPPAAAAAAAGSDASAAQKPLMDALPEHMEVLNMFSSPTFSGIAGPDQERGVGNVMSMLMVYDPNSRFRNEEQNHAREVKRQVDWGQLDYWLNVGEFQKFFQIERVGHIG